MYADQSNDLHNTFVTDNLTIKDLNTIIKELWPARSKWKFIGLELCFEITDLQPIEMDKSSVDNCFIEMLTKWLNRGDPPATWSALVAALKVPTIDLQELAKQVESKFLHPSSNISDTTDSGQATGPSEYKRKGTGITLYVYGKIMTVYRRSGNFRC